MESDDHSPRPRAPRRPRTDTASASPTLKKPKLDDAITDDKNKNATEQAESDGIDGDDMELATQPTTALPDDDDTEEEEEDEEEEEEETIEVPQTPPPVQVSAAAMTPSAIATTARRVATPRVGESLILRHHFPLLTDKSRVVSPAVEDSCGQQWRVLWYPHGQFLDDQYVSVYVEMVVDGEDNADTDTDVATHSTVAPRPVLVEIAMVDPRNHNERKHVQKSSTIVFSQQNHEFGVEQFVRRAQITSPKEALLNPDGDVEIEVRLQFVDEDAASGDASDTIDLDMDLEATDPSMSPVEEEDLLSVTPVVTPTAMALNTPRGAASSDADMLISYDSKTETGMVGLKNQGATCYMNSLLQTLFHLLAFRHVVYETPTEQEDTNDSVSLALQRVFYRLQTQRKAVSTKELTRSFGWSQIDSFMQHDVQELYRILCDRLEEKMKNTKVDNAIKKLFEGKVRSFVQCVNVDFQSFRDESFYDLQLDVKGCKDIYDSFRKYVEVEMLNGDNQYEAEGHGKQDAKKGVAFLQFPPVLNIQLKRFEYDPMRDGMVKIHDRFEFPKKLVLDEFAPSKQKKEGSSLVYHLHSVLVHSGDVHGGHYYVFIRPGKDIANSSDWYKFDDDQISRVDELTAVDGNFGSLGSSRPAVTTGSGGSTPLYSSILSPENGNRDGENGLDFQPVTEEADDDDRDRDAPSLGSSLMMPLGRSFASAYMLVYVRDGNNGIDILNDDCDNESPADVTMHVPTASNSEAEERHDVNNVCIPEALVQRFQEEEKAAARRKKQQQTEHLFMTFRIASDTSISKLKKITKNVDFSSFGNNGGLRIRIKRAATIHQLYARIYKQTGVPVAQQRLWKVITRENRTHRPDLPLNTEVLGCRVDGLIDDDASPKAPVRLFLQIIDPVDEPDAVSEALDAAKPIYRHFLSEFTPPDDEKTTSNDQDEAAETAAAAEEDEAIQDDGSGVLADTEELGMPAPNIGSAEILLFIKFYDLRKPLAERLEYMGNILIDARKTGSDLAKYIHEALGIPFAQELILYEEIQPVTVSEIDMSVSLAVSEIQHGDMICFQYAEDEAVLRESDKYPDVPSYFRYLLDRMDVLFYAYGHPDEEPIVVHLLFSNCYNDIIAQLAHQLGLPEEKKLYLRLYQHSPLNQLPKKNPLRHSKFSGDTQTTLDDFLTEYSERTNVMYYEILDNPITEIESKKQVLVYLSIYDDCFEVNGSSGGPRRTEFLVTPTETLSDLFQHIRSVFDLEPSTRLRACEVSHNGSLVVRVIEEDDVSLDKYWGSSSSGYSTMNDVALYVERIPADEPVPDENGDKNGDLFCFGVVHFSFQSTSQHYIHPHGVPTVTYFRVGDTIQQVKQRIRQRLGVADEEFAKWELALVKDVKASTVKDIHQALEPDALENLFMGELRELCGNEFENITCLGLEHPDPKPSPPAPKYARRQEQGIKIRSG